MDPTFSLPPRSSPWTRKTGDMPPLCLLLGLTYQELQLEILFLSSVQLQFHFTFNLRTYFIGGKNCGVFSCDYYNKILQYEDTSNMWRPAGKMKTPRYGHSVAPVDDVSQLCG